jgi:glutamate N-acetyltransferase/amino-acid N-acetyltransferase
MIDFPKGFKGSGVTAGLKASGKSDLALIVNEGPDKNAAAVFTKNQFKAAPVIWSQQVIKDGSISAVLLNSGGANACTGPEGFADSHRCAEEVAEKLALSSSDVFICSTGLIGERLPMDVMLQGIAKSVEKLTTGSIESAARAIMTTDSVPKQAVYHGDGWSIVGMAKGAGMLAPSLATMLVVIMTDAKLESSKIDSLLREATYQSFDRIDSDGCMSTNDTVLLMSSGASGVIPDSKEFSDALVEVCGQLAHALIADAEGHTKIVKIVVTGADSESDAIEAAKSVARNNLLKCAINGEDPNWGRILAAVGTTAIRLDPSNVDVAINGVWVCRSSSPGESRDLVKMQDKEVEIIIDLKVGHESATVWSNDLSAMYVHENSAYST